jgi:hypothetical protein
MSKLVSTLFAASILLSGCMTTKQLIPELKETEHYWVDKGCYHLAYQIPSTDFYLYESSKNGQVENLEKIEEKIEKIKKGKIPNWKFEEVDDGNKLISPGEFDILLKKINSY